MSAIRAMAPFWAPWQGSSSAGGGDTGDIYVQRGHHYALVDEADNIFVDEARTPLIIAGPTRLATPEEGGVYHWANDLVQQMEMGSHFTFDIVHPDALYLAHMAVLFVLLVRAAESGSWPWSVAAVAFGAMGMLAKQPAHGSAVPLGVRQGSVHERGEQLVRVDERQLAA